MKKTDLQNLGRPEQLETLQHAIFNRRSLCKAVKLLICRAGINRSMSADLTSKPCGGAVADYFKGICLYSFDRTPRRLATLLSRIERITIKGQVGYTVVKDRVGLNPNAHQQDIHHGHLENDPERGPDAAEARHLDSGPDPNRTPLMESYLVTTLSRSFLSHDLW